jgi:hypothetical protein
MKKLKLKIEQLASSELLTREQMKNVLRSTVGGTCNVCWQCCTPDFGTCGQCNYQGSCGQCQGHGVPVYMCC